MNTIIIYSSKTGFTEKYAQWLKEDLACDDDNGGTTDPDTGAMEPEAPDVRRLERENFTPGELEHIKPFYLQGGLNYAAMNPIDRFLMAGFRKMLKSHADSSKERVMLQNIQDSFDKTDREKLKPLEEYLKQ